MTSVIEPWNCRFRHTVWIILYKTCNGQCYEWCNNRAYLSQWRHNRKCIPQRHPLLAKNPWKLTESLQHRQVLQFLTIQSMNFWPRNESTCVCWSFWNSGKCSEYLLKTLMPLLLFRRYLCINCTNCFKTRLPSIYQTQSLRGGYGTGKLGLAKVPVNSSRVSKQPSGSVKETIFI